MWDDGYSATMAGKGTDSVRLKILHLADAKRMSLRELSKGLNRKAGYLNDFIRKKSPFELDPRDALKLANILGVSPSELSVEHMMVDNIRETVASNNQGAVSSASGTQSLTGPRDLKVLGYVKAGKVGYYLDNGETLDMTMRPPSLVGVHSAYAVFVDDVSMVPAFRPGWVIWVHPKRTARPGESIIIQLHDGQAFIKELVRRTERVLICKQWNPEEEVRFDMTKIKDVHLVVGSSIDP